MEDILASPELFGVVSLALGVGDLEAMSRVNKAIKKAHDWRELYEKHSVSFPVGESRFVVFGNGWLHTCLVVKVIRKRAHSKTITVNGVRRRVKVHGRFNSIEFAAYDPSHFGSKTRNVFATDAYNPVRHDAQIAAENAYWADTL